MPRVYKVRCHPDYEKRLPQWRRQRDAIEGEDAIKLAGTDYLPALDSQKTGALAGMIAPRATEQAQQGSELIVPVTSYEAYKQRAVFLEAPSRTVTALSGTITRKPVTIEFPKSDLERLEMMGDDGEPFEEILSETVDEVIGIGRRGILIDRGPKEGDEAYATVYLAEAITDWRKRRGAKGRMVVSRVDLREPYETADGKTKTRIRRLSLGRPEPASDGDFERDLETESSDGEPIDPAVGGFRASVGLTTKDLEEGDIYFQEILVEVEGAGESTPESGLTPTGEKRYVRESIVIPRLPGGATLSEIPFVFFNPNSIKAKPTRPPIMGLTIVAISHYRNSADLEHGAHFTGVPTPIFSGWRIKGDVVLGAAAIISDNPAASASFLEFTGQGLGVLERLMKAKEMTMAALGARLLEQQSPAAESEAAETVRLRHSGEEASLSRISKSISQGATKVLRFFGLFLGMAPDAADKVKATLSTDFGTERIDPAMLQALMQLVQGQLLSWNSFFEILRRAEMLPEGLTPEEEAERILAGIAGRDAIVELADLIRQRTAPPDPNAGEDDEEDDDDGEGADAGKKKAEPAKPESEPKAKPKGKKKPAKT